MSKREPYFSSWIENLGVVPLFRFFAFLFFPIFVLLFFLFDSVAAVFETISKFLTKIVKFFNNPKCLPLLRRTVKKIFPIYFLVQNIGLANENILISKGEIRELKINSIKKLTIGNPEIISQTVSPKKNVLLLRGKMVGFTELKIWTHSDKILSFQIHVLQKNKHLTLTQNLNALKQMPLKAQLQGTVISVEGILENEKDRKLLLLLIKKHPTLINSKVTLSEDLRNNLCQKIFSYFSKANLGQMECQNDFLDLVLLIPQMEKDNRELRKYLSDQYGVKFLIKDQMDFSNYLLKLKIIQIEKQNGDSIGLNLNYKPEILRDLFRAGLKQYLDLNNINFERHQLEISTLAEPEIITLVGKKAIVEIGAEISFPSEKENVIWKFAGIKTELELLKIGNIFQLNYKTQMTKPFGDSSISGNKESASAIVELGKPIQLFQIGFKTEGKNSEGMPFFQQVPVLREIFGTTSNHSTYKKITGFLLLEEYGGKSEL